ncbi:hypothetical protein EHH44_20670 [Mycolicibacter terrae]|uniref:Uncharacterized protein n=1 Tax=Mycolicibacter terrae TaxID=1788 RepID=A0ACD2EHQ7_9MYCO|nr:MULTISPECIES: hypothetical protein [Mycolicibacter]RRR40294.1 hypothetical protein EHH44_20670 [Mycolicibacter terrae]
MTTPGLRVVPEGLRARAQRCDVLAGQVAVTLPTVAAPSWQSSSAAATAVSAGANRVGMVLGSRMHATAAELTAAARDYEAMDDGGAAALAAVGSGAPGGSPSGDGGAGGLGLPR